MVDFKINIGMSTNTILNNLDKLTNATNKTKKLIFNFCQNDQDKKVTNEIELAMLDSWASGSEQVKMPSAKKMQEVKNQPIGYELMGSDKGRTHVYRASNNRLFGTITNNNANIAYASHKINSKNFSKIDYLCDKNKDGYADYRITRENCYTDNNAYSELDVHYTDDNMDGIYDEKIVIELNDNGKTWTTRKTITNLNTNKTNVFLDKK